MVSYWKGKTRDKATREKISNSLKGRGSFYKHGLSQTPIYHAWEAAKSRCRNKNDPRYKSYGGRGIKMQWETFKEFHQDMGDTYKKGLQLDRIDNNGNYCKENCRWATRKQQQNNMRSNITFTLTEICEAIGLSYGVVSTRLKRDWSLKEALKKAGDCFSCTGKGYSTQIEFASGTDEWTHEEYRHQLDYYIPCTRCDRGKQIAGMLKKSRQEGIIYQNSLKQNYNDAQAYQRGVEEGKRLAVDSIADTIKRVKAHGRSLDDTDWNYVFSFTLEATTPTEGDEKRV